MGFRDGLTLAPLPPMSNYRGLAHGYRSYASLPDIGSRDPTTPFGTRWQTLLFVHPTRTSGQGKRGGTDDVDVVVCWVVLRPEAMERPRRVCGLTTSDWV